MQTTLQFKLQALPMPPANRYAVAVVACSLLLQGAHAQAASKLADDNGILGMSDGVFVLVLCIGTVLVCGVFLACSTRICGERCTCCGARSHNVISTVSRKARVAHCAHAAVVCRTGCAAACVRALSASVPLRSRRAHRN